jgi:hypothetical protein
MGPAIQCLGGRQQGTLRRPLGLDQSALVKATPTSMQPSSLHLSAWLGMASSTSLPSRQPEKCVGQCIQPFDAIQIGVAHARPASACCRARSAPDSFQDAVALGQAAQLVERGQEVGGKATAAGTGFDHHGPGGGQHLRHLSRQRLAKSGVSSGAVRKSPPSAWSPNFCAPPA